MLAYAAVIKPSWKMRVSGNQGWALEGPGWCFFDFFFFRDHVYLLYTPPPKKKVGITWITRLNLVKMYQERFVFFGECYRQYLKELKWDLVMKTAVWRARDFLSQQTISQDWCSLALEEVRGGPVGQRWSKSLYPEKMLWFRTCSRWALSRFPDAKLLLCSWKWTPYKI